MTFFSFKRGVHIDGPDVDDMKTTMENLCIELQGEIYDDGLDAETTIITLNDIYKWITGTSKGRAIRLPAPAADPDDRHRSMWPEGAKVRTRSRRDSQVSQTSSKLSNGVRVPNINVNAYARSNASSSYSARHPPVKVKFMEDDELNSGVRSISLRNVRGGISEAIQNSNNDANKPRASEGRGNQTRNMYQQYEDEVEQLDTTSKARPRNFNKQPIREQSKRNIFVEDD